MDAVVIQLNQISYAECGGKTMDVPCSPDADILGDYWATPIKDSGIVRGYGLTLWASTVAAPTPDSFRVTRLYDKINTNSIHILGTVAQYRTACGGGAALPLVTTIPIAVPELNLCAPLTLGGTDYTLWWPLPALTGGQTTYTVAVIYNNTQPVAPGTGLANITAIITYLNTNYAAAGTWSNDAGRIKLVRATAATVGLTIKGV